MKTKRLLGLILILLFWSGAFSSTFGQAYNLQKVSLLNMAGFYRLMIELDYPVKFVDKFDRRLSVLTLYFKNTMLKLSKKDFAYGHGPVNEIHAVQLKEHPAIAKLTVIMTGPVLYEVNKRMGGLLYIDIKPEVRTERRSTSLDQNLDSSFSNHQSTSRNSDGHSESASYYSAFRESKNLRNGDIDLPSPLTSPEKITLDVNSATLSNVLRLIAKQSGVNIIAGPDTAFVTVSLKDVTVKEALDLVVKANGFEYIVENGIVLVKPRDKFQAPELVTKVYRLKYVDANNLKNSVSQFLSSQAKVEVYYHGYQREQSEEERRANPRNDRSSTLIVTDSKANIEQLNAMVEALDVPTPQIMIEAKLLEISPQHEQKLGINWSKTINAQVFREVLLPSGTPQRQTAEIPLTGGSISYGTLTIDEYSAVIDFLNQNTNSKLVSNPRILAMDNQEARISVGTTFPIPQINRGVGGQGDVVTFQYRDINIALNVTPHVSDDDMITLFVNPEVEEVIGEVSAGGNTAPITSKRTVETVVNLRNNETMVIGGLIRENTIDTISKVWFLGDIPLIGNFFRHKTKMKKQTDLLIFITPRLVSGL
ncbi:MAG: secretin N-terminal domain-containing protein [bacterium]